MRNTQAVPGKAPTDAAKPNNNYWQAKYSSTHRPVRIKEFPVGIEPPQKVRIYRRASHFLLQWWDKGAKKTLSERIDSDLFDAIVRAHEIDRRLEVRGSTGRGVARIGHQDLVDRYLESLQRHADAGEIDADTVTRYASALNRHYLTYALQPAVERKFRNVNSVNRDFQLGLAAYLNTATVQPNGHTNSKPRPMRRPDYVLDVARAMYLWAADPDQGKLLPEDFRNPFLRRGRRQRQAPPNQLGEPDITVPMAADFLQACDDYQLRLFAPLVLYGLRPSELCYLFGNPDDRHGLDVVCRPELDYRTKGGRDKRLPLVPPLPELLYGNGKGRPSGLLYLRRCAVEGSGRIRLLASTREELVAEFERRCKQDRVHTAADRRRVRDQVLRDAGGMNYDHIATEFQ